MERIFIYQIFIAFNLLVIQPLFYNFIAPMKHYLQNPLFFLLFLLAFNSCKQSSVPLNGNLKADQLPSQLDRKSVV